MYRYDDRDRTLVRERVAQFRDQTDRYLAGELTDDQFRPLRLQNGLYIQRLAPMLRISIPYGLISAVQLRRLARIARHYDKGYAHFTTRQNVQFNWPRLEEVPAILAELAEVEMHAIQTSGNCVRNITTDEFAGVAPDEIEDPRPWCELVRQWATFHPEFAFLPRKFKIAISGSASDRAAIQIHDIGLQLHRDGGALGFRVFVGGGLGRTPMLGEVIRDRLEPRHLRTYLDAILRLYNRYGRRDNKHKARIKILVKAWGAAEFAHRVEAEWQQLRDGPNTIDAAEIAHFRSFFTAPDYRAGEQSAVERELAARSGAERAFARWLERNVRPHRIPGYAAVTLSLKPIGIPPGDVTASQLEAIAELAEAFSFGEARVTHHQNLVLADVRRADLYPLWQRLKALGFATPTIGTLNDIICCPGGDFCSLANAKSIPIAEAIQREFDDLDYLYDLGDLSLNISGCMNACGHHHVGNIGILGVDKKGEEFYQIQIGGAAGSDAALGQVLGPSFYAPEVPGAIARILETYVELRREGESFIETCRRVGVDPFRERAYAKAA
ncbi:MAG: nitrite/sulfite reductase [Pseudomonadota bacterium]|jgi:sulfite reductase (NADPH) hemoprotein beta-component